MKNKTDFIVYLGTYPPRKCGIATFTQDLSTAFDKLNTNTSSKIIALNVEGDSYDYSDDVIYQITDSNGKHYLEAAKKINEDNRIKLVSIQHEFKIFGSDYGENLLVFLEELNKPVVTTLHSVLPAPSGYRKKIIRAIAEKSDCIVVMNKFAVEVLRNDYDLKDSKIVVIPHGIHDVPYESNKPIKESLKYADRELLVSFGFLRPGRKERSSGRGYEYAIEALPTIAKKFPNILYLIVGVTHPNTLRKEGEKYRRFLENRVKELGLEKNVGFINKYLELKELLRFIQAADIYVSSSLNKDQIVSGTLSYAMGCGRAVISTPFLHAKEIVSSDRGILVNFKDSNSIAEAVIKILSNPELKEKMEKNAYEFTRHMIWHNVALEYKKIFDEYISK